MCMCVYVVCCKHAYMKEVCIAGAVEGKQLHDADVCACVCVYIYIHIYESCMVKYAHA